MKRKFRKQRRRRSSAKSRYLMVVFRSTDLNAASVQDLGKHSSEDAPLIHARVRSYSGPYGNAAAIRIVICQIKSEFLPGEWRKLV